MFSNTMFILQDKTNLVLQFVSLTIWNFPINFICKTMINMKIYIEIF